MPDSKRLIRTALVGGMLCLLLLSPVAQAGERDPTAAELAEMILKGNAAEHALVTAWIDKADRAALRSVFAALRDLRNQRRAPTVPVKRPPAVPPTPRVQPPRFDPREVMLNADVRVIDIVPGQAEDVLGRFRPTAAKTWHIMTGTEVEDLLRSVNRSADATIIRAPRILVQSGQKANVSILDQVSYIKDYDIELGPGDMKIANPIVATIQDGLVIDLKGHLQENGSDIQMDFVGTWAALKRPIPEFEKEIHGQTLTFQIPELNVTRARASALLPNDGWALIGGGAIGHGDKKRERVALVNVRTVQVEPGTENEIDLRPVLPPPPPPVRRPDPIKKK